MKKQDFYVEKTGVDSTWLYDYPGASVTVSGQEKACVGKGDLERGWVEVSAHVGHGTMKTVFSARPRNKEDFFKAVLKAKKIVDEA